MQPANTQQYNFILASASPRRKELLQQFGFDFQIITSDILEESHCLQPSDYVMDLSMQKAFNVSQQNPVEHSIIIGADTIVTYQNQTLLKPTSRIDAFQTLSLLSDTTHEVYTGVTLLKRKEGLIQKHSFFEMTKVTFYKLTPDEIHTYIETNDPFDKAGGYGIQGVFSRFIRCIEGEYTNVVGFPVGRFYHELKTFI